MRSRPSSLYLRTIAASVEVDAEGSTVVARTSLVRRRWESKGRFFSVGLEKASTARSELGHCEGC